jgi:hypothetical protein
MIQSVACRYPVRSYWPYVTSRPRHNALENAFLDSVTVCGRSILFFSFFFTRFRSTLSVDSPCCLLFVPDSACTATVSFSVSSSSFLSHLRSQNRTAYSTARTALALVFKLLMMECKLISKTATEFPSYCCRLRSAELSTYVTDLFPCNS